MANCCESSFKRPHKAEGLLFSGWELRMSKVPHAFRQL